VKFEGRLPADNVNVTPTHPLGELALLVGGVAAAVVGLVVAVALCVDLLVPRLPVDVERRLFGSLGSLAAQAGEGHEARTAALQGLVDRMASHWPESPYRFEVAILEAEAPNALAFPGGLIAVTTGLLEQADSENEVAFVIGHELGHYRSRDHLRGLGRSLALGLVFAGLGLADSGAASSFAMLAGELTSRGFDRAQESRADAFGLALVHAEYGHVAGADDFFRRLAADDTAVDRLAGYLSTHPLSAVRIEEMHDLARSRGWTFTGPLAPLAVGEPTTAPVQD
jgi:Zn-dependent protease with chaperone function